MRRYIFYITINIYMNSQQFQIKIEMKIPLHKNNNLFLFAMLTWKSPN